MKRKTLSVTPCEASPADPATICHGLCREPDGTLVPGPSAMKAADGLWRPLCMLHPPHASPVALLTATHPDPSGKYPLALSALQGGTPAVFGSSGSEALCAAPTAGGAIVMTQSGPQHVELNDDGGGATLYGPMPPVRPVRLEAELRGTVTMNVGAMTFTGCDFSTTTPLDTKSLSRLSTALSEAYSDTTLRASASGLWIQPVIAFYRLRRADGTTLYTSPPRLLCAPGGWQGASGMATACTVSGETGNRTVSIPSFSATFNAFRIKATIPADILPGVWGRMVASIEICVSPQIHPSDPAAKPAYSFTGGSSATTFTVALPGATSRLASLSGLRRSTALKVAACATEACATECIVRNVATQSGTIAVNPSRPHTVSEDNALIARLQLKAAACGDIGESSRLLRDITAPHSFTARTVAVDGDSTVWGDITPIPFCGYPPEEFTAVADSNPDDEWDALSVVTFADGRKATALTSGTGNRPISAGPLLGYPSPDATLMELWVRRGTAVYKSAFTLTPDNSGAASWFIQPDLEPVVLEATSEPMPDCGTASEPGARHHGYLVTAPANAMLSAIGCQMCSTSAIKAIVAASRSLSSWDFSRSHLHAFTPAGIFAVAVNASHRIASASLISPRGVESADAVTSTPSGTFALPADGSGALLIKASRAENVAMPEKFTECSINATSGDIWLRNREGAITVMTPCGFTGTGLKATVLHGCGGIPLMHTTGGDTLRPESVADDTSAIEWKRQITADCQGAVTGIVWYVAATEFNGTLSVRAHSGSGQTYPLVKCEVSGQINSPLALRIAAPPRPYITLEIKGTASADFRFSGARIVLSRPQKP